MHCRSQGTEIITSAMDIFQLRFISQNQQSIKSIMQNTETV